MAPPPPIQCSVTGCEYFTGDDCDTYDRRSQDLRLHVDMVHLYNKLHEVDREDKHLDDFTKVLAKLERPSLEYRLTECQWGLFEFEWNNYKQGWEIS